MSKDRLFKAINDAKEMAYRIESIISPQSMIVKKDNTSHVLIELAPYIQAYKHYKNVLDNNKQDREVSDAQLAYQYQRQHLSNLLNSLANHNWDDISEEAKSSSAYRLFKANFSEILNQAVDETIAKYMESSRSSSRPVNKLEAKLSITVDNQTNPDNISITYLNNSRGHKKEFLDEISTLEGKKIYSEQTSDNQKPHSHAKTISEKIEIFMSNAGMNYRKLIGNVMQESSSNIIFSNKQDAAGHTSGAQVTIITPKSMINENNPLKSNKQILPPLPPVNKTQGMKLQMNNLRMYSPSTINTDFSDEDNSPKCSGPGRSKA